MTAWIMTDTDGRIETVSRSARELFNSVDFARGDDLAELLTLPRRAASFDIELASIGWPAQRVVSIDRLRGRFFTLRYRISRRLGGHGLFWQLHVVPTDRSASGQD